jgi:hypothetical protein
MLLGLVLVIEIELFDKPEPWGHFYEQGPWSVLSGDVSPSGPLGGLLANFL